MPSELSNLPTLSYQKCETLEYSGSGLYLATSHSYEGGVINLWNSDDITLYKNCKTYTSITMLRASATSNMLATCDANSALNVYNMSSMRKVRQFYHSTKQIINIAFSKQGLFASSCDDSTIKVWPLSGSSDKH